MATDTKYSVTYRAHERTDVDEIQNIRENLAEGTLAQISKACQDANCKAVLHDTHGFACGSVDCDGQWILAGGF